MEFSPRDTSVPLAGCGCSLCDAAREEQRKARPVNPFSASLQELYESLQAITVPFEPEPAKPEPVYTHVLVDYDEDGGPLEWAAELHTAESLIFAIEGRKDQEGRYQVYKLGTLILDVPPKE